ncbi:hypothetical protein FK545_02800 [Planococcus glaciei]|nr:hypothetical protein [Planococcus glaciei]QDY44831.1 hypothetical protein FK545_02800 [Planococcus glaciei]
MKIMQLVWLSLLIEILILAIIKPIFVSFEFLSIVSVSIHILLFTLIILSYKSKYNWIFLLAFLVRISFMIWDIYGRNIFILPNSEGDAIGFKDSAVAISENILLISTDVYGGLYAKVMGALFYIVGPQLILGHYINVLLSISVIYIIYLILKMLEINTWVISVILLIAAFFPNSIIMSAIFLREMIISFFVILSLYHYIKWIKFGKTFNVFLCILFLSMASMFHSGVVGIFLGYAFGFIFYKRSKEKVPF